ncbi:CBS domain-containing protein [Nesterenkonia sp. CF4.4]|uniref:CBS domain-containing protein n=1 Tax=Nesterenkonia sp. CF4.4 TaxID=3373079 RepID=UPI003EE69CD2
MEHFSHSTARPSGGHTTLTARGLSTTRVGDLMSAIESVVSVTAPLRDAAELVHRLDAAALVIGLSHQPLGLITEAALTDVARSHPGQWEKKRCAALIGAAPGPLSPSDPIQDVLACYRRSGAQPLLVLDEDEAVGIIYPDPVFDALGLGCDPR